MLLSAGLVPRSSSSSASRLLLSRAASRRQRYSSSQVPGNPGGFLARRNPDVVVHVGASVYSPRTAFVSIIDHHHHHHHHHRQYRQKRRQRADLSRFFSTHAERHSPVDVDFDDENDYHDEEGHSSSSPTRITGSRTSGLGGGDGHRRFSGGGGGGKNDNFHDMDGAVRTLLEAPLGSLSRKDVGNSAHRLVRSRLLGGDPQGAENVLRRVVRERDFHLQRLLRSGREQRAVAVAAAAVADEDYAASDDDGGSAADAAGNAAAPRAEGDDDGTSITYIKPILFHLVMDGWAKACGSDGNNNAVTPFEAAKRAERVFDLMKGNVRLSDDDDDDEQSQTAGYNTLISAWSRAAGASYSHGGDSDPDACYRAAERAESVLTRMLRHQSLDEGDANAATASASASSSAAPDAISYGTAIDAWANFAAKAKKHPKRDAAGRRAEALLNDAMERYNAHERGRRRSRSGGELLDDGDGDGDDTTPSAGPAPPPPPDARCFTGVIRAHSHGKHPKSAIKCEELLRRLVRFRDSISPDSPHHAALAPDPTLFAAVISAHANRARFDPAGAPRRADDVFRLMVDLGVGLHQDQHYDEGNNGHRGEASSSRDAGGASYAFNAVLRAHASASTKDAEAAFRAERLLNETMRDPDLDWLVDTVSFNTVLHALSRSRALGAPERAESILNFMERRSFGSDGGGGAMDGDEMGGICVRPDVTSYSSVINAFARGRCDPGAAANANDGGTGTGPSSSDSVDADGLARYKIDRAREILHRLEGWHRSLSDDDDHHLHHDDGGGRSHGGRSCGGGLKPNAVAYTSVINACAYAYPSPPSSGKRRGKRQAHASLAAVGRREAYETARSILDPCRKSNEIDHIVYSTMLVACRNLLPPKSAVRRDEVERLVEECKWDGCLSASVVEELARALKISSAAVSPGQTEEGDDMDDDDDAMLFDKLLGGYGNRVRFVGGSGKKKKKRDGAGKRLGVAVDVRDFPSEWSRNVMQDGRHRRSATT